MSRNRLPVAVLSVGVLAIAVGYVPGADEPPVTKENIEAALKLTRAAAAEYEIVIGKDEKPLELQRKPVLQWSNPEEGEVHGNIFVWTRETRPLVVGSLFKWFTAGGQMWHEFHSLAEEPLGAKFHSKQVWKTSGAGLEFVDVPKAAAPVANETQRLVQLKQLAKEFSGAGRYKKVPGDLELRLLPQPIHQYSAPKQDIVIGGLFAFVRGTDPDIFLLIEARGKDAARARWQFAVTRMHSAAKLWLRYQDKNVWESEPPPWGDIFDRHEHPYTTFTFKEVPDFLKDALPKPKP
jgi:hypothetical protein